MTFSEAIKKTIELAIHSGKLTYLYSVSDKYWISFFYRKDWLFRAYPGGRKELSTLGNKHKKNIEQVVNEWLENI